MHPIEPLINGLAENGWAVSDDIIDAHLRAQLFHAAESLWQQGHFHEATIGKGLTQTRNTLIRGDAICWLDHALGHTDINTFLDWADTLRSTLNRELFLGLNNAEFHFARYPSGHGYKKHMDQHAGAPERRISLVLYLTPQWVPANKGELLLFNPQAPNEIAQRIAPLPGRLVVFRSDLIPHEVATCAATRWSLTGWLRTDHGLL
jgi:SM-20-related protein